MARDLLTRAADEVDTARERTTDEETSERLAVLAGRLRSQAERDATPALGVLDRVLAKLDTVESEADEAAVAEPLGRAREDILSFLETLDDRGMKQHGWGGDANGSA